MQRDSYAILIKKKGRPTIDILIQQMSKEVTKERIFDEVFDGYDARRIILMTHMAMSQPPQVIPGGGPLLQRDTIINDWDTLVRIHKPNFMYRLLPLVCSTPTAFSALVGICQTPHSPFSIDDRKDQVAYRQKFWLTGPHRSLVEDFFRKKAEELAKLEAPPPPAGGLEVSSSRPVIELIDFDGVLISRDQKSIGFMRVVPIITPDKVHTLADMVDLSFAPEYKEIAPNGRHSEEFARFKNRYSFLAGEQPLLSPATRKQVLEAAARRGVTLYHQTEMGTFNFLHPER